MTDRDICGSTETADGEPCGNTPSEDDGLCWIHSSNTDSDPGRKNKLEEDPSIAEIVAGCLQNGDTVPEACAEAHISVSAYHRYLERGKRHFDDGVESVFRIFWEQATHARRVGSKNDRSMLKEKCMQTGDTKTLYRLHHDQYGDTYDEEGGDGTDVTGIPLVVPDNAMPDNP